MPFSTTKKGKGKKNPRVDLTIVTLDDDDETPAPVDLLAVIELKYYYSHTNSLGISKDLEHLEVLRKGIYYPYKPTRRLIPRKTYFLYLVEKGEILFNQKSEKKINRLKQDGYSKIFLGEGEREKFYIW
jgi:hypothetical protein